MAETSKQGDGSVLKVGPARVRWWRIWLLAAAWALGAGMVVAGAVMVTGHDPHSFEPDEPGAIALRVKDVSLELERGRPEVAASRLEAIRDEDPLNPYIHALYGQALGRMPGRESEAIAATRLAVSLDPLFADAWYNLACLYGRVGDNNGAMRALAEAAALGIDDAEAIAADEDLALIRDDPRVAYFLERGHMPASLRFAELLFEPAAPIVGEAFDVVVRGWSLDPDAAQEGERFVVRFLGASRSRLFRPLARTFKGGLNTLPGAVGWEVRYRLRAESPYAGVLGPWDVRIDGKKVAMVEQSLRIGAGGGGAQRAEVYFRPRHFFHAPWGDVTAAAGERWLKLSEGGWDGVNQAVEISPFPPGGPMTVGDAWHGTEPAPPFYDEWIVPPDGSAPAGFRRVFLSP